MTTIEILRRYGACDPAIKWVGERTPREAWDQCEDPQWLLWAVEKAGVAKPPFVRIASRITRAVLHLAPTDHARLAIESAEAWLADPSEANRLACRAAADASWDASGHANYQYANVYRAAGYAANAAARGDTTAYTASARIATCDAGYIDVVGITRAASCAIIREEIPWADMADGLGVDRE